MSKPNQQKSPAPKKVLRNDRDSPRDAVIENVSPRRQKIEPIPEETPRSTKIKIPLTKQQQSAKKAQEDMIASMVNQQLSKIQEQLDMSIASPLEWHCPNTQAEDWDNVPETSAIITLYLQKHQQAVVQYLNDQLALETTQQLRAFTIQGLKQQNDRLSEYEDKTDMELVLLQNKDENIQQIIYEYIKKTNARLTKWSETNIIEQQVFQMFFPENKVVLKDTEDELTNEQDNMIPLWENEARMFSLEQMQQLWHLFMNRSNAKKRLEQNDLDTKDVRERMLSMERWRESFLVEFQGYKESIKAEQSQQDQNHKWLIDRQAVDQNEALKQYRVNDKRDENYKRDYDKIMMLIDDHEANSNEIRELIDRNYSKLTHLIDDKTQLIMTTAAQTEGHLNLQIDKINREIERLKYELTEQMDNKYQQMQKTFALENYQIKESFTKAIENINEASNGLGGFIKGKMLKIKTRITKVFAEMDIKLSACQEDVLQFSRLSSDQHQSLQTASKFDAQIFTLQQLFKQSESDRQTTEGQLKEAVKSLLKAIQEQDTSQRTVDKVVGQRKASVATATVHNQVWQDLNTLPSIKLAKDEEVKVAPPSAFIQKVKHIIDSLDNTPAFKDYIQMATSKSVLNKERKKVFETATKLPTTAIESFKLRTPKHHGSEQLIPSLLSPREFSSTIEQSKVSEAKLDAKTYDFQTPHKPEYQQLFTLVDQGIKEQEQKMKERLKNKNDALRTQKRQ